MPPTLSPPPRPQAPSGGRPPRLPSRAPLSRPRRGRAPLVSSRALGVSLALHAVLGAVFLLAPGSGVPGPTRDAPAPAPSEAVAYLDLGDFPSAAGGGAPLAALPAEPGGAAADAVLDTASAPIPSRAAPRTSPASPAGADAPLRFPDRAPAGLAPPGGGASEPGRAAPAAGRPGAGFGGGAMGGRLRPGYADPRLTTPRDLPPAPVREPSPIERYRERLDARIGAVQDSIEEAQGRERRARDWTFGGKDGDRWGIGEGGHVIVAGRKIPIPIEPPIPRDRDQEDEVAERARQRGEIDRQAETIERERYLRERERAIRARQDSIRNARRNPPGSR